MADYDIGGGFLRGVAARRQIEETREIIADRARRTEADQKLGAMQARMQEMGAAGVLSMAKVRDVNARAARGEATAEEIDAAWQEYSVELSTFAGQASKLAIDTMASAPGNEYVAQRATQTFGLIQQSIATISNQVEARHRMTVEEKGLELERMRTEASVRASDANVADAYSNIRSREAKLPHEINALESEINRNEAETNRTMQTTDFESDLHPSNLRESEAKASGAEADARTATAQAGEAERVAKNNALFDSIGVLQKLGQAVDDMREEGISEDIIAKQTAAFGVTPQQVVSLRDDFDDDMTGRLKALDSKIDRAKKYAAEGKGSVEDVELLTRERDRIQIGQQKAQSEILRWNEMVAQEGSIGAAIETFKLVAQRRRFPLLMEILKGGPAGAFKRGLTYVYNADPEELLAEDSRWENWFGGYVPKDPGFAPSDMPPLQEQTERAVRQEFEGDGITHGPKGGPRTEYEQ